MTNVHMSQHKQGSRMIDDKTETQDSFNHDIQQQQPTTQTIDPTTMWSICLPPYDPKFVVQTFFNARYDLRLF